MQPGLASPQPVASAARLYSSRQIYLASFLGGPMAAAWIMSRNFRALSEQAQATRLLWQGLAVTFAVIAVALVLPEQVPRYIWPITYSVLIYQYARAVFDARYKRHLSEAGALGSWWMVVAVSLIGILIVIALALPMSIALEAFAKP